MQSLLATTELALAQWPAPSRFGKNVAERHWAGKDLIAVSNPVFADVVAKSAAGIPVPARTGSRPVNTEENLIATLSIRC
jgi:hypothetical protein